MASIKQYNLAIDFSKATASSGNYTFSYDVYKSLLEASSCCICNNGTIQSAPCIITKRVSGTYVLTYSSTSFYVNPDSPTVLAGTDPD